MKVSSSCCRMLSHEFKTALTGILGNAELLRNDKLTAKQAKSCVNDIYSSGIELLTFVNAILAETKQVSDEASIKQVALYQETNKDNAGVSTSLCLTVLVVEDDPILQRVHSKMLEDLGCLVKIAKDGYEALTMLTGKHGYEVVFMDIGLPKMNGIQTVKKIREQENNKFLPIIGVTAYQVDEIKEECKKASFTNLVAKPISLNGLKNILLKLFK